MSLYSNHHLPLSLRRHCSHFPNIKLSSRSRPSIWRYGEAVIRRGHTRICTISRDNNNAYGSTDASQSGSPTTDDEGSEEKTPIDPSESRSPTGVLIRLKRYGISGVLSYGILNTIYYLTTFLLVWFYVAPVPGRMGYLAAVERFVKVMAMVWAGSQVTKLLRAGGALALAPFVDQGLTLFTAKFKFESRGKAFMTLVGFCLGLAVIVFLTVTLLWA